MDKFRLVQRGDFDDGFERIADGQVLMEGVLGKGITVDMVVRAVRRGRCGCEKVPEKKSKVSKKDKKTKGDSKKPEDDQKATK